MRWCRWVHYLLHDLITSFPSLFWQVEGLLTRYASVLSSKSKWLEAVELYRRANRPTEAALLIGDIAEQVCSYTIRINFDSLLWISVESLFKSIDFVNKKHVGQRKFKINIICCILKPIVWQVVLPSWPLDVQTKIKMKNTWWWQER